MRRLPASKERPLLLGVQMRRARQDHVHGSPNQGDADSAADAPQDQALVAEPAAPGRLGRHSSEHHLRVGMRPAKSGPHHWPVSSALNHFQLVQVALILLALAPLHGVATVVASTCRIRARNPYVQRRQTAREGRRGENVRGAERWSRGDEPGGLSRSRGIGEVRKDKHFVAHGVMAACSFTLRAAESVGVGCAQRHSAPRAFRCGVGAWRTQPDPQAKLKLAARHDGPMRGRQAPKPVVRDRRVA